MYTQLLASKERTTGEASRTQRGSHKNLLLNINVSAITATPSVDLWLEVYAGNDQWLPVFKMSVGGAPLTAAGQRKVLLLDKIGAVQNSSYYDQIAEVPMFTEWRVRTVHGDADAITYSVDCTY